MSDSAGTSWLDVARDWSEQLLEVSGMPDQMPERQVPPPVVICVTRFAMNGASTVRWLSPGAATMRLPPAGPGAREGEGFVALAPGVLLAAKAAYKPDRPRRHTFCHAVPDTWYQMGVILAATDCLNWLSRTLGQTPATLAGLLPDQVTGPSSVTFLPYLSGERTPHNDARIRATLAGIDIGDGAAELTQAVMEGVAMLRDCPRRSKHRHQSHACLRWGAVPGRLIGWKPSTVLGVSSTFPTRASLRHWALPVWR